jgi:hypothetical protein
MNPMPLRFALSLRELSAAIELRRRFPGITDNAKEAAAVTTVLGDPAASSESRRPNPSE